jgi:hypothetical protein
MMLGSLQGSVAPQLVAVMMLGSTQGLVATQHDVVALAVGSIKGLLAYNLSPQQAVVAVAVMMLGWTQGSVATQPSTTTSCLWQS